MSEKWMPIESAPKDGAWVDLWIFGGMVDVDVYVPLASDVKAVTWRPPSPPGSET